MKYIYPILFLLGWACTAPAQADDVRYSKAVQFIRESLDARWMIKKTFDRKAIKFRVSPNTVAMGRRLKDFEPDLQERDPVKYTTAWIDDMIQRSYYEETFRLEQYAKEPFDWEANTVLMFCGRSEDFLMAELARGRGTVLRILFFFDQDNEVGDVIWKIIER